MGGFMGGGGSPMMVVKPKAATPAQTTQAETVTPAVARSISKDTADAQEQQIAARQRMRGVSSTYLRGTELANTTAGGKSKLGQ